MMLFLTRRCHLSFNLAIEEPEESSPSCAASTRGQLRPQKVRFPSRRPRSPCFSPVLSGGLGLELECVGGQASSASGPLHPPGCAFPAGSLPRRRFLPHVIAKPMKPLGFSVERYFREDFSPDSSRPDSSRMAGKPTAESNGAAADRHLNTCGVSRRLL